MEIKISNYDGTEILQVKDIDFTIVGTITNDMETAIETMNEVKEIISQYGEVNECVLGIRINTKKGKKK